jgi:hypothetical protein
MAPVLVTITIHSCSPASSISTFEEAGKGGRKIVKLDVGEEHLMEETVRQTEATNLFTKW